jgi:hypothetical protein
MDPESLVVLAIYPDGAVTPNFYIFKDGVLEEKC